MSGKGSQHKIELIKQAAAERKLTEDNEGSCEICNKLMTVEVMKKYLHIGLYVCSKHGREIGVLW